MFLDLSSPGMHGFEILRQLRGRFSQLPDTPMAQRGHEDTRLSFWPSILDMPSAWVVSAILLALRFRLREISVPPGAATIELIGALAPGIADPLIRWTTAAGRLIAGRSASTRRVRQTRRSSQRRSESDRTIPR